MGDFKAPVIARRFDGLSVFSRVDLRSVPKREQTVLPLVRAHVLTFRGSAHSARLLRRMDGITLRYVNGIRQTSLCRVSYIFLFHLYI